ncbi:DUF5666 domain-containing protein [[Pseudomonas] carboxydohydrogena]|uniref:DUF5666 domain-containing protein n=1 Tax=Afipia carboxydohydrogena TaxID=290 RepID=A0ABY8BP37_AFICR|nr:DUF5666 domain-containing protein [[Pseudomonas] carboxydohydrogena]WEF51136.1 DUF5666 domain-containing protein [[Pseudomonas] carboxydohydrogena]
MPLLRLLAICLAASLLTLTSAFADMRQPPASRVRGMIESINGDLLIVKKTDGHNVTIKMTPNAAITGVEKIAMPDIAPGAYIGVTSVADAQGNQKATEIHLFPDSLRGAGEGTRPWDTAPNSSMTNGGLDKMVESNDGSTLTVKYRGGEKQVVVTPETAVVKLVPGKRSDLREGAHIIAATARTADGALETSRVSVGIDGLTPPM